MIRIGIVDDQPLFVQGLSRLLEDQPDIVIGCSANSGKTTDRFAGYTSH